MAWAELCDEGDAVLCAILVAPRASQSVAVGLHDGALKIRLAAPPVDGAANKELITYLAKKLKVKKNDLSIISGLSSKRKRVRIEGCDLQRLKAVFHFV